MFPDDAADASALMKHADIAMYAAKQAGKNTCTRSTPSGARRAERILDAGADGSCETPRGVSGTRTPPIRARAMAPACAWLRFCRLLRVLDVAAQLVALLGRHLLRLLGPALALAVGVAHVVAHALAVLLAHLAVAAARASLLLLLGERARREHKGQNEGQDSPRDDKPHHPRRDVTRLALLVGLSVL